MFQFTVIPGVAERRPGIQSAAETLWIPAFAGMTEKNSITKIQTFKNAPCVKCVQRPVFQRGEQLFAGLGPAQPGGTLYSKPKSQAVHPGNFCAFFLYGRGHSIHEDIALIPALRTSAVLVVYLNVRLFCPVRHGPAKHHGNPDNNLFRCLGGLSLQGLCLYKLDTSFFYLLFI
jgi:hypothetical protein